MMCFGSYVAAAAEDLGGGKQDQGPPDRRGDRSRHCGESGPDRAADRRLLRLRPFRVASIEECTVKGGRIEQENFDSTEMRIARMPRSKASLCRAAASGWGWRAERSALRRPQVLNAFFDATGKRMRSFPLRLTLRIRVDPESRSQVGSPLSS